MLMARMDLGFPFPTSSTRTGWKAFYTTLAKKLSLSSIPAFWRSCKVNSVRNCQFFWNASIKASKIAHNLKGVSWNGGFQELGECFLLLEKLDSEDWQNKAKELQHQITEQWELIENWILSREEKLNRIVFIGEPSNHNLILLKKFLKDKNLQLETKEIHDPPQLRKGDVLWVDSQYQDRIFEELKSWETPDNLPVVYVTQEEVIDDLEDVDALLIPLEEPLVKGKVRQLITKLETLL